MQGFEFNTVRRIISGAGSALQLAEQCRRLGIARPLLVTDPGLMAVGLVQPVLDKYCVGCHNGRPCQAGGSAVATCDLRAKRLRPDWILSCSPVRSRESNLTLTSFSTGGSNLGRYIRALSGFASFAIGTLPIMAACKGVVPLPANGSITISPALV
mgnify:CR=1 FL=1